MNNYPEFIRYLDEKTRIGIKFGLENITYLMKKLGSPHKKLHCIHIAGTNGKGSVAAMLSSVLYEAGIRVGLYTSPHLVDVTERIRLNERDITEEEMLAVARKVIPLSLPETTYFELLTAIAIEFFYQKAVEIAIMEVGMGGRLDATNVCYGEIAIITDISLEHTQYLGNTIEEITREKMAIIKPGSIAITEKGDSPLFPERNTRLALKAIDALISKGYNITKESIDRGLSNVRWPGRFQIISKNPLIILDGAHNPGAAIALRQMVEKYIGEKVVLIIGILKDKDYRGILSILTPIAKRIITVTPKSERALSGEVLTHLSHETFVSSSDCTDIVNYKMSSFSITGENGGLRELIHDKPVEYIPNVNDALDFAKGDSPILVTGSLSLVGEVLSMRGCTLHTCEVQPRILI